MYNEFDRKKFGKSGNRIRNPKNILLREKQVFVEKWEKKWNKLKLKYELLIMNLTDDLEQESPRDAPFNRFSSSPEKKRGGTRKAITRKNKH